MAGGRAEITIDWKQVDQLLQAQCCGTEIANMLGVHKDTLYDRTVKDKGMSFSDYSASKQSNGRGILRHAQYKKAISGNHPMQIWLGKQYLKQKDREEELTIAPQQDNIDKDQIIMKLQHELETLKNGNELKTE